MRITTSENELIELLPEGSGDFYADGAYDSKKALNTVVEKGYQPIVKRTENPPGGFGSRRRDEVFSVEEYKHRNPHEGFWGAFTTWFGDRMLCFLRETTVTRILLGVMCYALKILLRVKYCLSNRG
ncbi:hypothetical protein [Palaeococcus sp. (in: euryarchaeotes)]